MHHAFGIAFIIAAIAFAFGETAARVVVGGALIAGLLAFAYIAVRVITGTI